MFWGVPNRYLACDVKSLQTRVKHMQLVNIADFKASLLQIKTAISSDDITRHIHVTLSTLKVFLLQN
jgi:hypothetical protein